MARHFHGCGLHAVLFFVSGVRRHAPAILSAVRPSIEFVLVEVEQDGCLEFYSQRPTFLARTRCVEFTFPPTDPAAILGPFIYPSSSSTLINAYMPAKHVIILPCNHKYHSFQYYPLLHIICTRSLGIVRSLCVRYIQIRRENKRK